jgi:hypothetical protein
VRCDVTSHYFVLGLWKTVIEDVGVDDGIIGQVLFGFYISFATPGSYGSSLAGSLAPLRMLKKFFSCEK